MKEIIDISMSELREIEDELYNNEICHINDNEFYIKNIPESVSRDVFIRVKKEYPDACKRGRSFYPVKAFALIKLIVDYYQLENNKFTNYIKRDPSCIDNNNLLDNNIRGDNILADATNILETSIHREFIDSYIIDREKNTKYEDVNKIYDKLFILENIIKFLKKKCEKQIFNKMPKCKDGILYKLHFIKQGLVLQEKGDVLHIRYNNIISISNKVLREEIDKNDLVDEQIMEFLGEYKDIGLDSEELIEAIIRDKINL